MNPYAHQKTAVVLVDPFNDFLSEGGKMWPYVGETVARGQVVGHLTLLVQAARKHGIQVVYAPHRHTREGDYLNWKHLSPSQLGSKQMVLFEHGSWGAQFHPALQPQPGDLIAQNHWTASGFANTDLDLLLRMHGIEAVVIGGMRANTCIDCTARYAVELGYHVTLIKDAIGSFNREEIRATVELTFPHYGHALLTAAEFAAVLEGQP